VLDIIINQGAADGPLASGGKLMFQSFNVLTKEGNHPSVGGLNVSGKKFTKNLVYLL
jgi:hypothetical protein